MSHSRMSLVKNISMQDLERMIQQNHHNATILLARGTCVYERNIFVYNVGLVYTTFSRLFPSMNVGTCLCTSELYLCRRDLYLCQRDLYVWVKKDMFRHSCQIIIYSTCSHVRSAPVVWVPWLIRMSDMTQSCVTWLPYSYLWHDPFMTHSFVCRVSFMMHS